MTCYTLDASVALAKILGESRPDWVDEILADVRQGTLDLVAPALLWIEIGNRLVRRDVSDERALEAMLRADALGVEAVELHRPLLMRCLQVARDHRVSMYDASYLAVAESFDAPVLTLDRQLDEAAAAMGLSRSGPAGVSEPKARYSLAQPVDRISVAAIGAALAEMRREYSI